MTVFMVIISALSAFLFGFIFGTLSVPAAKTVKPENPAADDEALEKLKKEYSNFLSYDGSEQL